MRSLDMDLDWRRRGRVHIFQVGFIVENVLECCSCAHVKSIVLSGMDTLCAVAGVRCESIVEEMWEAVVKAEWTVFLCVISNATVSSAIHTKIQERSKELCGNVHRENVQCSNVFVTI